MELNPKPRFHALTWGQLIGVLIILAGMFCYWMGVDHARVPGTITWRVSVIVLVVILSFVIPQVLNSELLKRIATDQSDNKEKLADNHIIVRRMLWCYAYGNLLLVTYLVHITGGITGSMFASLFVMLPSIPLLLRSGPADVRKMGWYILSCACAIFVSFLMSHFNYVEFNASTTVHAYDLSMLVVTLGAIMVPLFESFILRYQIEKEKETSGSGRKS
jgi:drug/metabolite transporter (DMT)-like permease